MTTAPDCLVTVVIATHNRSNVLVHAIESVRRQTMQAWEVIVVDDGSTDDTLGVVEAFGDPRIRAIEMGQNFGEQSAPNNVGALLARAPLLALLNHDDVWFPDHLSSLLACKQASGARLVYAMQAIAPAPPARPSWELVGWRPEFNPRFEARASTWLLDRDLHLDLQGWRPARTLRLESSNEFLFRAWRAGARPTPSGRLTVLAESSGLRKHSYRDRLDELQIGWSQSLSDDADAFRAQILADAVPHDLGVEPVGVRGRVASAAKAAAVWSLAHAGAPPRETLARFKGRGRGEHIRDLRRTRGLDD